MEGKLWSHLLVGNEAGNTKLFSGGACNVIRLGKIVRNTGRDELNAWLSAKGIYFFDPQIHPDTHGRDYEWEIDGPAEQTARSVAQVTLYELRSDTMCAVTCEEILVDAYSGKRLIIWLNGDKDSKGNLLFSPDGIESFLPPVAEAYLKDYIGAGNKLRKNLITFVKMLSNVTICNSLQEVQQAIQEVSL